MSSQQSKSIHLGLLKISCHRVLPLQPVQKTRPIISQLLILKKTVMAAAQVRKMLTSRTCQLKKRTKTLQTRMILPSKSAVQPSAIISSSTTLIYWMIMPQGQLLTKTIRRSVGRIQLISQLARFLAKKRRRNRLTLISIRT